MSTVSRKSSGEKPNENSSLLDLMGIEEELRKLGVKPVTGQNFLKDDQIIDALVEAGEVKGETVLEIGAGTGKITEKLRDQASKVYALEIDDALCDRLDERFAETDIETIKKDFLDYDIPEEVERCVSNLPFQISSEAVEKLGEEQIQSVLILQEELADKMVAEPGSSDYNYFTVVVNYHFVPVKLRKVSRESYYPSPEVDTAIVKLYPNKERHGVENEELFFKITKAFFTHKRKKARNAFVDARHILDIEKGRAKEIRDEMPHSEERVINLEIIHLKEVAKYLSDNLF